MRIAMVGQKGIPATYGGIERHVEELAVRLVERGHEVTVYCRPYYCHTNGNYRGITLKNLPSVRTKHLDAATHSLIATLHSLGGKYDVVHFHALGPSSLALIPRIIGASSVATVHGLDWQREKWGFWATQVLKWCEVCSARFPQRTIVVSETLREYYEKRYGRRVIHIPNGTNPAVVRAPNKIRELGLAGDDYILFIGRLVPEKGCHLALEAYEGIDTDKKLVFGGSSSFTDDYFRDLKQRAGNGVRFLGWVEGELLEELWSNAYLVVHPSAMEGLSIALLEAMSYARCVLASDIPENMEALGDSGVSFRRGDAADLRRRLEELLHDPQRVRALGEQARQRVERKYGWDVVTQETEAVYRSLIR